MNNVIFRKQNGGYEIYHRSTGYNVGRITLGTPSTVEYKKEESLDAGSRQEIEEFLADLNKDRSVVRKTWGQRFLSWLRRK